MGPALREDEVRALGAEPPEPGDPRQVGPFVLLGVLGVGGMGRVYLGWSGGTLAAVKVIRPELADDPRFRRRFGRELEAVRRLDAAFTAPLLDAQADAARPWLATRYVPGIALEDAAGSGRPLPAEAVWRLAADVATALQGIHGAGIIHRDLKPSNVILAADGPKVIDFGVAHAAGLSQLTVTGQHVGTPSYMAPEQARTGQVGRASDVFSLGGLLMFAATGRPPFGTGSPTEVLFRVVHEPPDLSGLEQADPYLRALVERCLHKDPEQRPHAAEVAAAARERAAGTAWPDPLQERIEPRAALAAKASGGEPAALSGGETSVGEGDGLPCRAPVPAPAPRSRRRLVLAASLAAVCLAGGGIAAGLLVRHPETTAYTAAPVATHPSSPAVHAPSGAAHQGGAASSQTQPAADSGGWNPGSGGAAPATVPGPVAAQPAPAAPAPADPVPAQPGPSPAGSTAAPRNPASGCTYYSGTAITQYGDAGRNVVQVQCLLRSHGYSLGHYGVDGRFGPDTRTAVEQFQRAHHLTVDGIVGGDTWRALRA